MSPLAAAATAPATLIARFTFLRCLAGSAGSGRVVAVVFGLKITLVVLALALLVCRNDAGKVQADVEGAQVA